MLSNVVACRDVLRNIQTTEIPMGEQQSHNLGKTVRWSAISLSDPLVFEGTGLVN